MAELTIESRLEVMREIEEQAGSLRARFLAAQIPSGLFYADATAGNTFTNAWFYEKLGASEKDMVGHSWLKFVHRNDRTRVHKVWTAFWNDDRPYEVAYRAVAKSGTVRYFRTKARKFVNSLGMTCALGITEDISDDKRSNERLGKISLSVFNKAEHDSDTISEEIHASISQELSLLRLKIQLGIPELPEDKKTLLSDLMGPLDRALTKSYDVAQRLSPLHLKALGLQAALEDLCAQISRVHRKKLEVAVGGINKVVSEKNAVQVYRIVQEAFSGIVKYSTATKICIRTEKIEDTFLLVISDNGQSVYRDQRRNDSVSLHIMSERARLIRAKLQFNEGHFGGEISLEIK